MIIIGMLGWKNLELKLKSLRDKAKNKGLCSLKNELKKEEKRI